MVLTVLPRADPRGQLPWPLGLCAPHQQCWGLWSITGLHKQSPRPPHSTHTHTHTHRPSQAEPTPNPQCTHTHTHTHTQLFTSRAHARPTVSTHTHTHSRTHTHAHTRALVLRRVCTVLSRAPRFALIKDGLPGEGSCKRGTPPTQEPPAPTGVGALLSRPNQFNAACSGRVTSAGPAGFCTPSPPPPPPGEPLGLVLTLER